MKEKRTVIRGISAHEDSQAVFLSREKDVLSQLYVSMHCTSYTITINMSDIAWFQNITHQLKKLQNKLVFFKWLWCLTQFSSLQTWFIRFFLYILVLLPVKLMCVLWCYKWIKKQSFVAQILQGDNMTKRWSVRKMQFWFRKSSLTLYSRWGTRKSTGNVRCF